MRIWPFRLFDGNCTTSLSKIEISQSDAGSWRRSAPKKPYQVAKWVPHLQAKAYPMRRNISSVVSLPTARINRAQVINVLNSRNCTKHNCRCDYMDIQAARDETAPATAALPPNLLLTPEIDAEVEQWRITGVPPFPELNFTPRSDWNRFPKSTLRLIYHIAGLSIDLHRRGLSETTVWSPHILRSVNISRWENSLAGKSDNNFEFSIVCSPLPLRVTL